MPKKEILLVTYEDGDRTLIYADEADWYRGERGAQFFERPLVALERLADFMDLKAEHRNNHSHVGAHRALAAFLHEQLGRPRATEVMKELARLGGLDGMQGLTLDFGDYLEALKVPMDPEHFWREWHLPD